MKLVWIDVIGAYCQETLRELYDIVWLVRIRKTKVPKRLSLEG